MPRVPALLLPTEFKVHSDAQAGVEMDLGTLENQHFVGIDLYQRCNIKPVCEGPVESGTADAGPSAVSFVELNLLARGDPPSAHNEDEAACRQKGDRTRLRNCCRHGAVDFVSRGGVAQRVPGRAAVERKGLIGRVRRGVIAPGNCIVQIARY